MYRLLLHRNVEKQLARIQKNYARRLADAIRTLRDDHRPVNAKHLTPQVYRLREGDYRIVYAVFDDEQVVFVGKVARRSEKTYRDVAALLDAAHQAVKGE